MHVILMTKPEGTLKVRIMRQIQSRIVSNYVVHIFYHPQYSPPFSASTSALSGGCISIDNVVLHLNAEVGDIIR